MGLATVLVLAAGCGTTQLSPGKVGSSKSQTTKSSASLGRSVEQSISRMETRKTASSGARTAKATPAKAQASAAKGGTGTGRLPRQPVAEAAILPAPGEIREASVAAPTVSLGGASYRIGPEDVLHISVWESKELTIDAMVRPDGMISVPLIQDVQAAGLTAAELADVIQKRLLTYVKDPQVSVIVSQVNAPKIFVIGNVSRPGPYPLRSDMTVLQALSLAGGFNQFAGKRSIKLVRGVGTKQEVRKINYYDVIGGEGEGNFLLKPGDTIVVP
jgi:polysaccharide export outer membrane protein